MRKNFSAIDQSKFARLSGDANPIHVNEEVARRLLFGAPVVHGLHLVLWAWEEVAKSIDVFCCLSELKAVFSQPTLVGDAVEVDVDFGEDSADVTVRGPSGNAAAIQFSWVQAERVKSDILGSYEDVLCRDLSFEEASAAAGELPLALDRKLLAQLAPNVERRFPEAQIALALATTQIVGMECPGQHSVFNSLKLRFTQQSMQATALVYDVAKAMERFSRLSLNMSSLGMEGEVAASFRPNYQSQAPMSEIEALVSSEEFSSQRALIVGGSRGLGEVAAKIITAGGGRVLLTYNLGKNDAEQLSRELGPSSHTVAFNVTAIEMDDLNEEISEFKATHLYYFASPRILLNRSSDSFNRDQFSEYISFYVEGFARTVRNISKDIGSNLKVFYPSTVFLDEPVDGAWEYIAAKSAGEATCQALMQDDDIKILIRRLPQLTTDQTVGLLGVSGADPVLPIRDIVREMNDF